MRLTTNDEADWLRDKENLLYFYLYVAYLEARKGGKRATFDEHRFEINEFENLLRLARAILENKYKHFIYDSYSCREDKGTLMGIERLQHHIRSAS